MLTEKTKTPKKKIINKGNLVNDVIADIAISKYLNNEIFETPNFLFCLSYSTPFCLNPIKEIPIFFIKHIQIGIKRIIYQYFVIDFNPGSLEILLSILMSIISLSIVITSRYKSALYDIPISPGVSSLITITSLMAFQLLISFIYYDCTYRVLLRNSK